MRLNDLNKLILSFLFFCIALIAQPEDLFKQAGEKYQNKDYSSAIELYNQIISQGYESPEIHYNLGNAYFRLNEIGKSILNYEKALKLNPDDEDAKHNLEIARAHTIDKINEVPELFFTSWWKSLVTALNSDQWGIFTALIFIFFIAALGFYLLSKEYTKQRIAFYFSGILLFATIFSAVLLTSRIKVDEDSNYAILIEDIITTKTSPDPRSNDSFVIHEGVKFLIEDELNDWARIKLADGKVGWLPKSSFENI